MTTLRDAAQQALEAMEVWGDSLFDENALPGWRFSVLGEKAITDLRAALSEEAMQRLTDVQQEIEAPSQQSQQVEPVAYVTGYSKGRCIIEAVDPDWLLPVGMALYRSPPTINEMETVEPVAYRLMLAE